MRRLFPPLAPLALLLALLAPAAARAEEFTKKAVTFEVTVGPADDTKCNVVADLYTPNGVSSANRAPALLATNGFGGSKNDFGTLGASFAKRGYVFLAYSGLGFGGSGCKIQLDDPDWDGKAGSQLVSFLGGSKAATDGTKIDYVERDAVAHDGSRRSDDPRVGMIGGSYGGQIQFAIAGIDPRVDALVPQITWNDLSYSLVPNNTDFASGVTYRTPGVTKSDWPVLFFGLGVAQGLQASAADPSHLGQCPNFDSRACASLVETVSLGYPSQQTLDFLRHASVASYIDRIRIPTFLSQGLSDSLFNMQEAVATYSALRNQGTPVKMLWRSSGHSGGGLGKSEFDNEKLEAAYESRMALEWLDFWLKGIGDVPALDFTFLRDWASYKGDAAPAVGRTPTYPGGSEVTMFLSGSDGLVGTARDVKAGTAPFAALPAGLTGSGNGFQEVAVPDAPATSVSFTTAPLAEDFDLVGVPRVTLSLDAPSFAATQGDHSGKLVLFARLVDVDPAGNAVKLPRNLLSAVRVADVTKPVTIELPGTAHRFRKGHQMRLVLATSNSTSRGNTLAGPVTVMVDPATPSTLTVPRLGAQTGADGSGPSGTTPFAAAVGAPAPHQAVRPAFARKGASLPRQSRSCAKRKRFVVTLPRTRRGELIRSVVVTVNGKRRKAQRSGRRLVLRNVPKGTFRLVVSARTTGGRTLRSARTYKACARSK